MMPDIVTLITRWWKQVLLVIVVAVCTTAVVLLVRPAQYLGETTALPAPTFATDKAGVFGRNVQILYPSLGTADDLDMILGTARLDTLYAAVTDQLRLADYYQTGTGGEGRQKALTRLKKHTRVSRTDYGELRVRVWDADRNQVAAMANAIMNQLRSMHRDIQNRTNETFLDNIRRDMQRVRETYLAVADSLRSAVSDSPSGNMLQKRSAALLEQVGTYEQLESEYTLMVQTKPEVLMVVEKAVPPVWRDQLHPALVLAAAALLGLFLALLLAILLEKRRPAA